VHLAVYKFAAYLGNESIFIHVILLFDYKKRKKSQKKENPIFDNESDRSSVFNPITTN